MKDIAKKSESDIVFLALTDTDEWLSMRKQRIQISFPTVNFPFLWGRASFNCFMRDACILIMKWNAMFKYGPIHHHDGLDVGTTKMYVYRYAFYIIDSKYVPMLYGIHLGESLHFRLR